MKSVLLSGPSTLLATAARETQFTLRHREQSLLATLASFIIKDYEAIIYFLKRVLYIFYLTLYTIKTPRQSI